MLRKSLLGKFITKEDVKVKQQYGKLVEKVQQFYFQLQEEVKKKDQSVKVNSIMEKGLKVQRMTTLDISKGQSIKGTTENRNAWPNHEQRGTDSTEYIKFYGATCRFFCLPKEEEEVDERGDESKRNECM